MNVEKRRYKISSFRDLGENVRVILTPAELVKKKQDQISARDMMRNPMGVAQNMIDQQMKQMIHDTFLVSKQEYHDKKYMVGEIIWVTIEREKP